MKLTEDRIKKIILEELNELAAEAEPAADKPAEKSSYTSSGDDALGRLFPSDSRRYRVRPPHDLRRTTRVSGGRDAHPPGGRAAAAATQGTPNLGDGGHRRPWRHDPGVCRHVSCCGIRLPRHCDSDRQHPAVASSRTGGRRPQRTAQRPR